MTLRNPYEFTRAEYNELVRNMPNPVYSQKSEYEEIELVEDCTLFDLYRQPRQPVTDPNATRSVYVRVLNEDLNCPVCLSVMRETSVVKECLHRFCAECIEKQLRTAKSECPSCRMHIPSRRSLRRDTNFDELIARIYTNVDEFRDREERLIAEINRERHCNNSVRESTKLGVAKQQEIRRNGGKKKSSDPESPSSSEASSPDSESSNKRQASWPASASNGSASTEENGHKKQRLASNDAAPAETNGSTRADGHASTEATAASSRPAHDDKEKVNIRILVHPEDTSAPTLGRGLFRTSLRLTVSHLKKHLKNVLKVDSVDGMRIVLPALNHKQSGLREKEKQELETAEGPVVVRKDLMYDQELEDFVSLKDIYRQYGMGTQWELKLYYHFSDTIVNGVAQFLSNGA